MLLRLASALDVPLLLEAVTEKLPPTGTLPVFIFLLTDSLNGVSTVGLSYDSSQALLFFDDGHLGGGVVQLRVPSEAKAILDQAIGVE